MAPKKDSAASKAEDKPPKEETKKGKKETKEGDAKDAKGDAKDVNAPPRPNKEAYEKRIQAVQEQIEGKKEEIKKVIETIDKKSTGKEGYETSRGGLFDELKTIKARRGEFIEKKQELVKQGRAEREAAFQSKRELQDMEKAGKDLNEESLEAKINQLEYKLETSGNLTLKEEKGIMKQIKDYRAQLPKAVAHTKKLEQLKAGQAATDGSSAPQASRQETIKSLDEQLDALKVEQEGISKKLDKLKETRDGEMDKLKPLIEKRGTLRDAVGTLIEEKKNIVGERNKAYDAWRAYEDKMREERRSREQAEWDKWRAEQEKVAAEKELEQPNPFLGETTLLEQTIDYCKGLLPKEAAAKEEEKEIQHLEGFQAMKSKRDRDNEMYFEATKGKKGKKNMKNLTPKEDKELSTGAGKKAIKHTAESFSIFKQLEVSTPMSVGELPELLEALQKKLDLVNKKVEDWEAERKAKVAAAKDAAEKAGGEAKEE